MTEDLRAKTCCFTGHRRIPREALPRLERRLSEELEALAARDVYKRQHVDVAAHGSLLHPAVGNPDVFHHQLKLFKVFPDFLNLSLIHI